MRIVRRHYCNGVRKPAQRARTVLFVSHNEYFISKVANRIIGAWKEAQEIMGSIGEE